MLQYNPLKIYFHDNHSPSNSKWPKGMSYPVFMKNKNNKLHI